MLVVAVTVLVVEDAALEVAAFMVAVEALVDPILA
jgi:hypothetical protein